MMYLKPQGANTLTSTNTHKTLHAINATGKLSARILVNKKNRRKKLLLNMKKNHRNRRKAAKRPRERLKKTWKNRHRN